MSLQTLRSHSAFKAIASTLSPSSILAALSVSVRKNAFAFEIIYPLPNRHNYQRRRWFSAHSQPTLDSSGYDAVFDKNRNSTSLWIDYLLTMPNSSSRDRLTQNRPQTAMERIRNFPTGVRHLLRDAYKYRLIHEAHATQTNAWKGRMPRRQYEEQRQVRHDVLSMLPWVLIWIPPIIGFLPPIMAIWAARQVMSHHFHNAYELELFARIEYEQRVAFYQDLADILWKKSLSSGALSSIDSLASSGGDAAGPLVDTRTLWILFDEKSSEHHASFSLRNMTRSSLEILALAVGIHQHLPVQMSQRAVSVSPSSWLRHQVERRSRMMCYDDQLLIEEGHHENACLSLTGDEVTNACMLRGLPVSEHVSSIDERRLCLTNHLKLVATVLESESLVGNDTTFSERFRFFTLLLTPLRYDLQRRYPTAKNP